MMRLVTMFGAFALALIEAFLSCHLGAGGGGPRPDDDDDYGLGKHEERVVMRVMVVVRLRYLWLLQAWARG
jgi:hypothetical protein